MGPLVPRLRPWALCQDRPRAFTPQEAGVTMSSCLHKKPEAQRGWVACPRLHSIEAKPGFRPRSLGTTHSPSHLTRG